MPSPAIKAPTIGELRKRERTETVPGAGDGQQQHDRLLDHVEDGVVERRLRLGGEPSDEIPRDPVEEFADDHRGEDDDQRRQPFQDGVSVVGIVQELIHGLFSGDSAAVRGGMSTATSTAQTRKGKPGSCLPGSMTLGWL